MSFNIFSSRRPNKYNNKKSLVRRRPVLIEAISLAFDFMIHTIWFDASLPFKIVSRVQLNEIVDD